MQHNLSSITLAQDLSNCEFYRNEVILLKQSYQAFCAAEEDMYEQELTASVVNGEVVSESESDLPEMYADISNPLSPAGKKLIKETDNDKTRWKRKKRELLLKNVSFATKCQRELMES